MGGRGARGGFSKQYNEYGTQYHTVTQAGNIKFVEKNFRQAEHLMETMTKGRVYVQVGGDKLLRVVFFDKHNKRDRVLEYDKRHKEWHVHTGYFHKENSILEHEPLTREDKIILERIKKKWHNYLKA